jgi:hypothetical protein
LDAALASPEGLHVPTFAKAWGVSIRTVDRDIVTFRDLGREIVHHKNGSPEQHRRILSGDLRSVLGKRFTATIRRYPEGTLPLFVCNLRASHQETVKSVLAPEEEE